MPCDLVLYGDIKWMFWKDILFIIFGNDGQIHETVYIKRGGWLAKTTFRLLLHVLRFDLPLSVRSFQFEVFSPGERFRCQVSRSNFMSKSSRSLEISVSELQVQMVEIV
jgi:hypothetical protein